jgi:hypothetical protein
LEQYKPNQEEQPESGGKSNEYWSTTKATACTWSIQMETNDRCQPILDLLSHMQSVQMGEVQRLPKRSRMDVVALCRRLQKPKQEMEQVMDEKQSVERFVQGWNASLYELEDLLDEMEDTKNKKVLETIQEIRNFIKSTENYWQLIKVDK